MPDFAKTGGNYNADTRTLILGIGNILLGDEGIGVHVARWMQGTSLPDNVDVIDGGTGGLQLLYHVQNYDRIILVDASLDDLPEGYVRVTYPRYSSEFPPSLSAHDIGLRDLIDAMILLDNLPAMVLVAISIKHFDSLSIELSPRIRQAGLIARKQILEMVAEEASHLS